MSLYLLDGIADLLFDVLQLLGLVGGQERVVLGLEESENLLGLRHAADVGLSETQIRLLHVQSLQTRSAAEREGHRVAGKGVWHRGRESGGTDGACDKRSCDHDVHFATQPLVAAKGFRCAPLEVFECGNNKCVIRTPQS